FALVLVLGQPALAQAAVPTPESVLGYSIGADYHLTEWAKIVDYFDQLDKASDRVQVMRYGATTLGRPMIVAVVSSEDNLKNLKEYQDISASLADPRGLSAEEADRLIAKGKPIYWVCANIHSPEVGSSEMVMELAYKLATGNDAETRQILDNVIVVLDPSVSPDGHDTFTEWYNKYKDSGMTERPPYTGKYVSHDNNRDWIMLALAEDAQNAAARALFHPQFYHDLHQTGPARMFATPAADPDDPNITAITRADWIKYGGYMLAEMTARGMAGVVVATRYDNFYPGYNDEYTTLHNGQGMIFETNGGFGANPDTSGPKALEKENHWFQPMPWKGAVWRLRDNIDYQGTGVWLCLKLTAIEKDVALRHFYLKGKQAVEAGSKEAPYAYVLPAGQEDPLAPVDLVNLFLKQGIEVKQSFTPLTIEGRTYDPGSYFVLLNQPYRAMAKTLLEKQDYPAYYGAPYDVTGWTVGLLQDVETVAIGDKAIQSVALVPVTQKAVPVSTLAATDAPFYLVEHSSNNYVAKALNELWAKGAKVSWAKQDFTVGGQAYPAGTFKIQGTTSSDLNQLALKYGLDVHATAAQPSGTFKDLRAPKIGLYHSWTDTMREGWTRYTLDYYGFAYDWLDNTAIKTGDLSKYDVIIIPDIKSSNILDGSAKLPEEYRGGVGKDGAARLGDFVKAGGTLLAYGKGSAFVVEQGLTPGVKLVDLKGVNVPGSVLAVRVTQGLPWTYGFDPQESVFYENNHAFVVDQGNVLASYFDSPLQSGFLDDKDKKLSGKAAVCETTVGQGRVVLAGPDLTYRFQTQGDLPFVFNTIWESIR
ncbi:MAG TPA: M14 family zinc carboxypeptidase, partial [Bacillota bacterium]